MSNSNHGQEKNSSSMSQISPNEEIKEKKYQNFNDKTIHNNPKENNYSESINNNSNSNNDNIIIGNNNQNNIIINTSINRIKLKEGSEDNKSDLLSNNNKDEETLNKLINNIKSINNNTNIIDKKDINKNFEENKKKSVHSQFGIQYVIQADLFQNMINEIKDYTATNKELIGNMVGSMNFYTQRVDKLIEHNGEMLKLLIEQNGEMLKILTNLKMKRNISDIEKNNDEKKEGVGDKNKDKKKEEVHDEEE